MTFIQACVFGGSCNANYLDTTYDPVALYLLNDSLSDSSASGFDDLTVTGTESYADVGLGLRGFYFGGTEQLLLDSIESSLQITGDVTVECIINYPFSTSELHCMYCSGSGETEDANNMYQLSIVANTRYLSYFAERSTGVNISYSGSPKVVVAVGEPVLVGMVRSSDVITFYVNGKPIGDSSGTLSAPTGGTSTTFGIGTTAINGGIISSVSYTHLTLPTKRIV